MAGDNKKPIVKATGLSKIVPLVGNGGASRLAILQDIDLAVMPGEAVAVVGASGSGKSTLLGLLAGLDTPTGGSVELDGVALFALDEDGRAEVRKRLVGFVFQSFQLLPPLNALENVMLPLELAGGSHRQARGLALDALAAVGLDVRLDRYPDDFSGGQQQRIAIARAIVGERRLLLADEPTGSLDTASGDEVIELLAALPRDHGTAVVLVTHEPRFASWADRFVFLRDGRIVDETVATAGAAR
jgi:putative ABC transport system ATP-binding protein